MTPTEEDLTQVTHLLELGRLVERQTKHVAELARIAKQLTVEGTALELRVVRLENLTETLQTEDSLSP